MDKKIYNECLNHINELLKRTYNEIFIAAMNLTSEDGIIAYYYEPEEKLPFTLDEPFDSEDPNVQHLMDLYLEIGKTVMLIELNIK